MRILEGFLLGATGAGVYSFIEGFIKGFFKNTRRNR